MFWGVWAIIGATSHSWFPWPLWVTLGWGVGLAFNVWDVYGRKPVTDDAIQREMQRDSSTRPEIAEKEPMFTKIVVGVEGPAKPSEMRCA